jgi:hypothetical protein
MKIKKLPKDITSIDKLLPIIYQIQEIADESDKYCKNRPNISFVIDLLNGVTLKINKKRIFMQTAFGPDQIQEAIYGGCEEFIKWYKIHKK